MNYRHGFHAGNFADVVKHAILVGLLRHLRGKDRPFAVLDTHAGAGRYELGSIEAKRTGEAASGIGRLHPRRCAPPLADYLTLVGEANPGQWKPGAPPRRYPGSPDIIRSLLRAHDRLVACELHRQEVRKLRALLAGDARVAVHERDGWAALRAFLPPPERRGLVLIDPPFEVRGEFATMAEQTVAAHRRWPTGQYMLWYPIKDMAGPELLHAGLSESGIRRILRVTFLRHAELLPDRLNGCGLLLINPPWQFDAELPPLLDALAPLAEPGAPRGVTWLVPE